MICMICDDEKKELEDIERLILEYAAEHPELCMEVRCFSGPLDMLEEMGRSGAPDIALLDICMPGVLGTEIAREIKSMSEDDTDIIFLTTSSDFAVEAFSLHVCDYLKKPYTKERLTRTLDRVVAERKNRIFASIKCMAGIYRIDLHQVLYAEARDHIVEIHLKSGKCLQTRTTLTELRRLFENVSGVEPVGVSYIVNLRWTRGISSNILEMENGDIIPVPRRLRRELKQKYFDYYTREATVK